MQILEYDISFTNENDMQNDKNYEFLDEIQQMTDYSN